MSEARTSVSAGVDADSRRSRPWRRFAISRSANARELTRALCELGFLFVARTLLRLLEDFCVIMCVSVSAEKAFSPFYLMREQGIGLAAESRPWADAAGQKECYLATGSSIQYPRRL